MKRLSLILLLFASFAAKAQTGYWPTPPRPSSSSFSPTFQKVPNGTDSLTQILITIGGKSTYLLDLAPQTRAYFDPLVFTGPGTDISHPVTIDTVKKLIVFNPGVRSIDGVNNMSLSAYSLNFQATGFTSNFSPNHWEMTNGDTSIHYLNITSNTDTTRVANSVPLAFKNQAVIYRIPVNPYDIVNKKYVDALPASNPNQIIAGLSLTVITPGDTVLNVGSGTWRINNIIYSKASVTTLIIPKQGTLESRYCTIYATTSNTIGIAVEDTTLTPIPPNIPDNTVFVGTVLITPTGVISSFITNQDFYFQNGIFTDDRTVYGGGHSLYFYFVDSLGAAGLRIDSTSISMAVSGKTGNGGAQFIGDTTQVNFGYVLNNNFYGTVINRPGQILQGWIDSTGRRTTINWRHLDTLGKGIEVQIDDSTAFLHYRNRHNETATRAYGLAIPDMNILRSVTDSVKGTIPTIYSADGTISGNRTITQNANILTVTSVDGNFTSSFSNQGISGFQTGQSNSAINVSSSISSLAGIAQLSTVDSLAGGSAVTAATSLNNHTSIASIQTAKADASKFKMIEMYNQTVSGENGITFFDRIDSIGARYQSRDDYKYMGNDTLGIPPIGWVMRYVAAHAAAGNIYTIDGAIPTSTARTVTIPTGAQLILAANDGGTNFSTSTFAPSGITLNALGAGAAQVELNGTHAQFQYNQGGLENITFDASGEIIHDALGNIGLQYDSSVDSSQFKLNPLSLPDSKWVLNRIASYPHGTVTAITGTPSRITSTGGTTPAIDISSTFEALLQKTANFVDSETPSGAINGSNVTYTLANTPTTGSVHLYLNGIRVTTFTLSTNTITWTATAPSGSDTLLADYRK